MPRVEAKFRISVVVLSREIEFSGFMVKEGIANIRV